MACIHEGRRFPWQQSQGSGCMMIIFMILVVSGCAHHGESKHGDYGHGSSSYGHGSTSYGHADMKKDGHHHFSRSMREELMLTDLQKQAFDRIDADYEKMVIKKTADIRAAEIDLAAFLAKEEPDRQAIQEQVQAMGKIKEDMMMARIDSLLTLKAILTEGQYDQFRELLKQRMTQTMGHGSHE